MSRGWLYRDGSPLSSCNLQEPWIRMILGFVGITDIDFVVAEGVAHRDRGNGEREQYLKPIREQVRFKAGAQLASTKNCGD
jgi:FMN-dependent NADH-azoreductase